MQVPRSDLTEVGSATTITVGGGGRVGGVAGHTRTHACCHYFWRIVEEVMRLLLLSLES
jgi:hypothetical protein